MDDNQSNINLLLSDFNNEDISSDGEVCRSRESFDRFCDDLCAVVLDFLAFEDKIRFECVAKQWKRCLFNRQTVVKMSLQSDTMNGKNSLNKLIKSSVNNSLHGHVNLIAFENILKKCEFMNQIVFDKTVKPNEKLLQLIARHCPHLKKIAFDFDNINEKGLIEFGLKCGQNLQCIEFFGAHFNKNYKTLLKLCPNLLSINGLRVHDIINSSDCLAPKLTKVNKLFESNETQLVKVFVDRYKNTLKSFGTNPNSDIGENRQNCLLQQISRLENLEELILEFYFFDGFSPQFAEYLQQIAFRCKKIERLYIDTHDVCSMLAYQIFDSIRCFVSLKWLTLHLPKPLFGPYGDEQFTIQSLVDCKQLTYLALTHPTINDNFFTDIDIYAPNLICLDLLIEKEISDYAMLSLSKLKKLKRITLRRPQDVFKFSFVTDYGLCNLISNCSAIKSIRFNSRPNMTYKTIEALIALAWKRPRINYRHYFGSMGKKCDPSFAVIDMNYYTCLPNNLKVTVNNKLSDIFEF